MIFPYFTWGQLVFLLFYGWHLRSKSASVATFCCPGCWRVGWLWPLLSVLLIASCLAVVREKLLRWLRLWMSSVSTLGASCDDLWWPNCWGLNLCQLCFGVKPVFPWLKNVACVELTAECWPVLTWLLSSPVMTLVFSKSCIDPAAERVSWWPGCWVKIWSYLASDCAFCCLVSEASADLTGRGWPVLTCLMSWVIVNVAQIITTHSI